MANITFLEAGGASTGGTELWDSIIGTVTADTSVKPVGAYSSLKIDTGVPSVLIANDVIGTANRISLYRRATAQPGLTDSIIQLRDVGGFELGRLSITSGGKLRWTDGSGSTAGTGATTVSLSLFHRIAVSFNTNGTADNLSVKVYLDGGLELDLTGLNTDGRNPGSILRVQGAGDGGPINFAHIYVDDGSDLTDPGDIQCTAKFPTAVNHNNWDTIIGTGAVNQRPLSEADGIESLLTTGTDQDYNLQVINDGDVNLTSLTQVGYMGWVWAKEASVAGSPAIIVNGTPYSITLTTSSAIYRKAITSGAYPSNAATIGMTSGTVATFMYECGMVVAFLAPEQVKLATLAFAGR